MCVLHCGCSPTLVSTSLMLNLYLLHPYRLQSNVGLCKINNAASCTLTPPTDDALRGNWLRRLSAADQFC